MLCKVLAALGFTKPSVREDGMAFCWEEFRCGIVYDGGIDAAALRKEGWSVANLSSHDLDVLARVFGELEELQSDFRLRLSAKGTKRKISEPEQKILKALHRLGVPEPDRNFQVRDADGRIRAVPDFAWENIKGVPVKVCLEVDGWHHHHGVDLIAELKEAGGNSREEKAVKGVLRAKGAQDAEKRRLLTTAGWHVIICHDTEIVAGKAGEIASQVREVLEARFMEGRRRLVADARSESSPAAESLEGLVTNG